ncbi:MAG: hypothetical protein PWP23_2657 [Candidatus Sumerlaeota bacterium]|nr:hypothetical protein [Candidatus Sumerlaeota bacterium]
MLATTLPVCAFLAMGSVSWSDEGHKTEIIESCGDTTIVWDINQGITITTHGVLVSKGTSFWVMKPDWSERIYGISDSPSILDDAVVSVENGEKTITLVFSPPDEDGSLPVEGELSLRMRPDNSLTMSARFKLLKETDAIVEWGVARMTPTAFLGASYAGESWDGNTVQGKIPSTPLSSEVEESTVVKNLKSLNLGSRLAPIEISANEQSRVIFFDYRANRWAKPEEPIFWLGSMERSITAGEDYYFEATLDFGEIDRTQTHSVTTRTNGVRLLSTEEALVPAGLNQPLIPTPKQVEFTGSDLRLSDDAPLAIYVGENPSDQIQSTARFLQQEAKKFYNLESEIHAESAPPSAKRAIMLGGKSAAERCEASGLEIPEHNEGYALVVDENVVAVAANTPKGLQHGTMTLTQLIGADLRGVAIRGARISDYPSLDFRGVHFHSGKDTADEICKALRDLIARFKLNTVVWECSYINWDNHQEGVHPDYGMPKDDARLVVDAARQNRLELIPLIQSLGHAEWVFTNRTNMDIAEDPETPYAVSPSNPDTYKFLFSIYEEAVELFDPQYFHIGHDEVSMLGRFPFRSKSPDKTSTDLIIDHINVLKEWFDARKINVMMWGDMFLASGEARDATFAHSLDEARDRRQRLSKDIVITDWHYSPESPENYPSIALWKKEGFRVIGASWNTPLNIQNLARACIDANAYGMLQTTWAGFNFRINGNESQWSQYWAYILAAHYFWSGDATPPEELHFEARKVFLRHWFDEKPLLQPKSGTFLEIASVANRSGIDGQGGGWLDYDGQFDLTDLPAGQSRLGETQFYLADAQQENVCVLLRGLLNPDGEFPDQVDLRLVEPHNASEIHFLIAATYNTQDGRKIGSIEVSFEDNSTVTLDLVYGENIFAMHDVRIGRTSTIAWDGETRSGSAAHLWDLSLDIPDSINSPCSSIRVKSDNTEAAPVLFAVTLVD